jgi:phenylalanyl-tRNA synthetase beta chain
MRISLNWLSEYVDFGGLSAADEVAKRLTAVGLEVEAIERTGQGLSGVVAARILASEKHPNAEKLSVTRVDAGKGEPLQIVCGAKNYAVGDVVPLATVGTVLPGGAKIEKAKLRGVESFGMLCSERELGLAEDASGLLILDPAIAPGTPIAKALGLEDVLLEVNVTPNRPDALSHVGIAREVAAALGAKVRIPAPASASRPRRR